MEITSDSNFLQLMKLRGEDDSRITGWLEKKTKKYTAPDMQNEILKTMALQVLRQVVESIHSAPFLTLMIDETTDVSNIEQVVICFRWVDSNLESHEEFIGLYQVDSTQSSTLVATIHDVLQRVNVSIIKLRGQCYDGASSMSGSRGGVAVQLQKEEPRALYTHCYGHALNLACSDAVKNCKVMRDALDTTYELIKLVKKSPRRDSTLQKLKEQMPEDSPGIRVLCPTRWTVRAEALHSILANYEVLQMLWEESLDFVKDTEMRSQIQGVSSCMMSFDFFFGVSLGELLLKHSDNLSKTLQASSMSAAEGQKIADMTVRTLQSIRSDENFLLFWKSINQKAKDHGIDEPVLPRRRKRPRRYEDGASEGDVPESVESLYRRTYYEALDLIIRGIKERFDQPGYKMYCNLEALLVKAAKKEKYDEEFQFVTDFYKDDFDHDQLNMQLGVLSSTVPCESAQDLSSVVNYLRELSQPQRSLLSEVCTLASLILVMPVTNAVSERSFSALRRSKSYLRATMTQTRLNNILVLHVHKNRTDQLCLAEVGKEFVKGSSS